MPLRLNRLLQQASSFHQELSADTQFAGGSSESEFWRILVALLLHRTNPARAQKTHNRSLPPSYPPRCLLKHGSAPPAASTTRTTTPRSAACVRRPVCALSSAPRLPLPLLPRRHQLLLSRPILPSVLEIVGTVKADRGRRCEVHSCCGKEVLKDLTRCQS